MGDAAADQQVQTGPFAPLRWVPFHRLPGGWQMAIDEWLLDTAVALPARGAAPVLRFYQWERPTLSLGFHQRRLEPHWSVLAGAGVLDLVRRPSGGRAVLHAGDLTYAFIWPDPPPSRLEAYQVACRWLLDAFEQLGLPLRFGVQPGGATASNCFATSTPADLVHPCGAKRIGSAQLRRRGRVLQHGSILLDPPRELWREVFGGPPPFLPALPLGVEDLIGHLRESARRHLPQGSTPLKSGSPDAGCPTPWELESRDLEPWEWAAIEGRLDRYRIRGATASRVTSPEVSMERAT